MESASSRTLVVNDGGSGLLLLDAATGQTDLRLEIPESTSTVPACITPDGETLLATAGDPPRVIGDLDWIASRSNRDRRARTLSAVADRIAALPPVTAAIPTSTDVSTG